MDGPGSSAAASHNGNLQRRLTKGLCSTLILPTTADLWRPLGSSTNTSEPDFSSDRYAVFPPGAARYACTCAAPADLSERTHA